MIGLLKTPRSAMAKSVAPTHRIATVTTKNLKNEEIMKHSM